jgi:hypothetical protein
VQQDQTPVTKTNQNPRCTAAGKAGPHFPHSFSTLDLAAQRHSDRPAEFNSQDIVAYRLSVGGVQTFKPLPNRLVSIVATVEKSGNSFVLFRYM